LFLTLATLLYLLPWQFSQFSLATQTASLFFTYSLGFISRSKLISFVKIQSIALLISYILMFANRMLITSLFVSLLCAIWIILLMDNLFNCDWHKNLKLKIYKILVMNVSIVFLTILCKKTLLQFIVTEDDSHIWDILKSKFNSNHQTFDTRLYTCAREFDYLERETFAKLCATNLLIVAAMNCLLYGIIEIYKFFHAKNTEEYVALLNFNNHPFLKLSEDAFKRRYLSKPVRFELTFSKKVHLRRF